LGKKRRHPRTYVLGDLHGASKALNEVLRKINFDYEEDELIFLGDLADGWGEFDKCLSTFKKIRNFTPIIGNHDLYLMHFLETETPKSEWIPRGGATTIKTIEKNPDVINDLHQYFEKSKFYHIDDEKIYCHGGFNHKRTIIGQKKLNFAINRQMYKIAKKYEKQKLKFNVKFDDQDSIPIKEIFIGHSTTKKFKPTMWANLINVDTGAGSVGHLTIMDVKRKKYVQSTKVEKLYKRKRDT
jgi:serine/threonine protein phosphatase 1